MAKSTIESLEKLLVKYISPIEQKFAIVMKELKKLEDKIDHLEARRPSTNAEAGRNESTKSAAKPSADLPAAATPPQPQLERTQRTRTRAGRGPTHAATPPATDAAKTTPIRGPITQRAPVPTVVAPVAPVCVTAPPAPPALSSPAVTDAVFTADTIEDETKEWITVNRKFKRPSMRRNAVTGSGAIDSDLQTVERVRKMHICFLKHNTAPESVISYMNRKSPSNDYHVEKIALAHSHYSSFSVTVPYSRFKFFMSAENWPPGIEVSEWFRRSARRARGASTSSQNHRRPITNSGEQPTASRSAGAAAATIL